MKNKLYTYIVTLLLICGVCTACSEDVFEEIDIMDTPVLLKGTFPTKDVIIEIGDSYVFEPQLKDSTDAQYSWNVNGQEVSTSATYTFKTTRPCQAEVSCTITNNMGKIVLSTMVSTNHDFTKGFYVVLPLEIGFYDTGKGAYYDSCYQSLNKGEKFGSDIYVMPYQSKLYITRNTNVSNTNHLFVVDGRTLQKKYATSIGANQLYTFMLDDRYMLITGGDVYRYDTKTQQAVKIYDYIYPFIFRAGLLNNKLLLSRSYNSQDDKLYYYELETVLNSGIEELPEAEVMSSIIQNNKSNFIQASDGSCYTLYSSSDNNEYKLIRILSDLTTEEVNLSFATPTTNWYNIYFPGITGVSSASNSFVLIPSKDNAIYKYTVGDESSLSTPFIAAPDDGKNLCGSGVLVDSEAQQIYALYQKPSGEGKGGYIVVYDYNGVQTKSISLGESIPQHLVFNSELSN